MRYRTCTLIKEIHWRSHIMYLWYTKTCVKNLNDAWLTGVANFRMPFLVCLDTFSVKLPQKCCVWKCPWASRRSESLASINVFPHREYQIGLWRHLVPFVHAIVQHQPVWRTRWCAVRRALLALLLLVRVNRIRQCRWPAPSPLLRALVVGVRAWPRHTYLKPLSELTSARAQRENCGWRYFYVLASHRARH